ncbi:MAG: hypothetical protein MRY57_03965 [Candidatus Pacebacteria bacterium]|nr:hypothetical protein [Candidatus Paceibacterota bacterium]
MNVLKKLFLPFLILILFLSPISIEIKNQAPDIVLNTASALSIGDCNALSASTYGNCFANGILTFYEIVVFYTTQILLVIIGLMFDAFLFFSLDSNFYRSGLIEAGWEILRDFTNIVFIFALLTIAFKLVLNQDDGKTKSTLIKTIIIALTINFSLFITYAIIDSSNILAQVFYNRIDATGQYSIDNGDTGDSPADASSITDWVAEITEGQKSVSLAVASNINPQKIIQQSGANNFIQAFIIVTSAGIMNILLGYIFITLMLLFLGRSLGLMISGIIAPIAFASLTVPSMQGLPYVGFNTWLKELIKLAFMAPVFMFFMYLIVTFLGNEGFLASITSRSGDGFLVVIMSTYMFFFIIGGLLLIAKKITTSMAGELGGMAVKGIAGVTSALVAGAAIAATGGAAAAGAGMRGLGAASRGVGKLAGNSKFGKAATAAGKGLSGTGKAAMAFKADVTKIPGFNKFADQSGVKGLGNILGKVSNKSYADADVAVRTGAKSALVGANQIRKGVSNALTGKNTDAVDNWQNRIQDSRDDLTKTRIENAQRVAVDKAKNEKGFITGIREDGTPIKDNRGMLKDRLQEYQANLAKMNAADKKAEKERIENAKTPHQDRLDYLNNEIKKTSDQAERANLRNQAKEVKETIENIEKTSTEGIIGQIQKQLDGVKNDARANLLKKDVKTRWTQQDSSLTVNKKRRQERVETQAARVGSGEIETKPTPTSKTDDSKGKKK